jgi:hypothetical protein
MGKHKRSDDRDAYRFLLLWGVVSALWTAALLFRVYRVWSPFSDQWSEFRRPQMLIGLFIPPTVFGIVMAAIYAIKKRIK